MSFPSRGLQSIWNFEQKSLTRGRLIRSGLMDTILLPTPYHGLLLVVECAAGTRGAEQFPEASAESMVPRTVAHGRYETPRRLTTSLSQWEATAGCSGRKHSWTAAACNGSHRGPFVRQHLCLLQYRLRRLLLLVRRVAVFAQDAFDAHAHLCPHILPHRPIDGDIAAHRLR